MGFDSEEKYGMLGMQRQRWRIEKEGIKSSNLEQEHKLKSDVGTYQVVLMIIQFVGSRKVDGHFRGWYVGIATPQTDLSSF